MALIGAEWLINKRRVEKNFGVPLNPPAPAPVAPANAANMQDIGGVQNID